MRRRIKSAGVSPEPSGLCGCWRLIAVERTTIALTKPAAARKPETEIACDASSHSHDGRNDAWLLETIVGHWGAIGNGVHRVRDVTFGEDACRVARTKAARNRVTLCNQAIGLFNIERHRARTKATSLPSWQRSMTPGTALKRVTRRPKCPDNFPGIIAPNPPCRGSRDAARIIPPTCGASPTPHDPPFHGVQAWTAPSPLLQMKRLCIGRKKARFF